MKKWIRYSAFLLALLMMLGTLLSCRPEAGSSEDSESEPQTNENDNQGTDTDPDENTGTDDGNTTEDGNKNEEDNKTEGDGKTEVEGQEVTIYKNKKPQYNIVIPRQPSAIDEQLAILIQERLSEYTGSLPSIVYENGNNYNKKTRSILIGDMGYDEYDQANEDLEVGEFAVKVIGNKIVLAGHFPLLRQKAGYLLLEKMANAVDADSPDLTLNVTDDWRGTDTDFLWDFPEFTDGTNKLSIDNENKTLMMIYTGVKNNEFTSYCQQIIAKGYTLWQEHRIGGNQFRTYRDGKKEIALSFYPEESGGTMHLFADAHKETALIPDADTNYEKVTEATLHVMSLHYDHRGNYNGKYDGHGMNYVITLEDGRFIVMDGGYSSTAGSNDDERIYKYLEANNKRKDGKIVIAAWFMSHPHGDHYGAFETFVSKYAGQVTIEYFIANPYSQLMVDGGESWYTSKMPGLLNRSGAKLLKPHTGQVITFCNTDLEIMYTHENLYPKKIGDSNNTSTVIRMHQNGYTALFSGDASTPACNQMVKLYGDELKSDLFQVNHHGCSGGTWEFYDAVTKDDSYVLWTCAKDTFFYRTYWNSDAERKLWEELYPELYMVDVNGTSRPKTIASGVLGANRELALKVGFENCFYADGVVEQIIFPLNGEITFVGERDYATDPRDTPTNQLP